MTIPTLDRNRYKALNESFRTRLVFQYGTGTGFGAETTSLIRHAILCLANNVQFVLGEQKPRGFAVKRGWEDYFEPLWRREASAWLSVLNRVAFPLPRLRVARWLSRKLLRRLCGNHLYLSDSPGPYSDERLALHGMTGGYWANAKDFCDIFWVYRPGVADAIAKHWQRLGIDGPFVAVHVRRGDKFIDWPYIPLEDYLRALALVDASLPIYVATDDRRVVSELAQSQPGRRILSNGNLVGQGYDQARFNRADAKDRFEATVFFLFELEMMVRAELFVGASPSNVLYLVRYRRGNVGLMDVGSDLGKSEWTPV